MSKRRKTIEPPLKLEMSFGEALERFVQTKPAEVAANIKKSKQKKPPGGKKPSGGNVHTDAVVSLRSKRMKRRNG